MHVDFENADYDGIASYLLNDPFFLSPRFDEEETVDQAWGKFDKPIEDAIQLFVPTKTIVAHQSNKRTKRYSGLIRCAMTKKTSSLESISHKQNDRE